MPSVPLLGVPIALLTVAGCGTSHPGRSDARAAEADRTSAGADLGPLHP